ncbi:DUF4446 family protein [Anaerotignum sp. MB30-C6]|uniref:DUF4446 family protein n=1 Tax=Anaerotignum sp. MB30-C6 TaxID=3070814 RepID=UPI0027DB93C1|nr:DUF4446 family protein [Anaerotignum sp. MB30-C6]WMI81162.1 DUF4446 family protein [Anaerotignum sp. MB30-C6]
MEMLQDYIIYILLALGIAVLVLFILCIILFLKLNKQKKKYDFFMGANRRPSHNLEMKIEKYYETSKSIEEKYGKLLDMVTDMDKTMRSNIQKVGLIRYNPFDEMGGNLCFALALLDGEDNGIVLNGIHSRTGSFTYAKPIQMGVSIYMLSEEEIKAVEMAKERAYHPEHEKVVKVKFKPTFRRKDKDPIMEEQMHLEAKVEEEETKKEYNAELGDVTLAEKEQIFQEEMIASQIAQVEVLNEETEVAEKDLVEGNIFQEVPVFTEKQVENQEQEEKE